MKKPLKKQAKYFLSIIPFVIIVVFCNSKMSPEPADSSPSFLQSFKYADLPCGYNAVGPHVSPATPTITTNNAIPVLQYPGGNYLQTNVYVPDAVYSKRKTDQLVLQGDGNLVIYCVTCQPVKPLWSTRTNGKGGKFLFFQTNGELVLRNASGRVIWHSTIQSKCAGSENAYFTLQDDGNLAMLYNEGPVKSANPNNDVSSAPPSPGNVSSSENQTFAYYLGGTASTNDQLTSPHPGKIQ